MGERGGRQIKLRKNIAAIMKITKFVRQVNRNDDENFNTERPESQFIRHAGTGGVREPEF